MAVPGRTTVQQSMHAASAAQNASSFDILIVKTGPKRIGVPQMCTPANDGGNLAVLKVRSSAHETTDTKQETLQREQNQPCL